MPNPSFRITRIITAAALVCAIFVVSGAETTAAQSINRSVSYQGKLLTVGQVPVSDGNYSIKFSLYDASIGGNRLWTAAGTNATPSAVTVAVQGGLFTVQLGDVSAGENPFTFDWNQDSIYLGVTVNTDSEMSPRKRLTSVPYAFVAETLQGQYASSQVDTTGGKLFALRQTSTTAATGDRTVLFIATSGTSNQYDYLIKGYNGSDVFTVSRQGNVTTTGNLAAAGNTIIGDASSDSLTINAKISSDVLPLSDATYRLGSTSFRWLGVDAVNATTTNATTTNLSVTNGVDSNLNPLADNIFYLGTSTLRWRGIDAVNSTSTNATTTNLFASNFTFTNGTSTGVLNFATASGTSVIVGGQSVCLKNGTNCPSTGSVASYWTYDSTNDFVRPNSNTTDLVLGGSTVQTAPVWFQVQSTSTNVYLGAYGSSTNVFLGGATSTILNPTFQLNGNDLFAAGDLGAAGSIYTNGTLYAQTAVSSTTFVAGSGSAGAPSYTFNGDSDTGIWSNTPGNIVFSNNGGTGLVIAPSQITSYDNIVPNGSNAISLGASGNAWKDVYASGTGAFDHVIVNSNGFVINSGLGYNLGGIASPGVQTLTVGGQNLNTVNIFNGATIGMTLISNGNVGIGTVNPTSFKLQVDGSVGPSSTNAYDLGSPSLSWRNIYASGTVYAGTDVVVGGNSVCLKSGTNCPAGSANYWSYNSANDFLRPNTATTDLVLGGSTVQTAPVWFQVQSTSTNLYLGANGSSTNVFIGGATSTIGNSQFQLNGNDLYAAGDIGAAGSIYTNGTLYAQTSVSSTQFIANPGSSAAPSYTFSGFPSSGLDMDGFGQLGIVLGGARYYIFGSTYTQGPGYTLQNSAWTGGSNNITDLGSPSNSFKNIYASGTAYIGTDVLVGNGASAQSVCLKDGTNCPTSGGGFWTYDVGTNTLSAVTSTKVLNVSANIRNILDADNQPVVMSMTTVGTNPKAIFVSGKYAYMANQGDNSMNVIDVSDPASPVVVSTTTVGVQPLSIFVSGRYAYVGDSNDQLHVIDVSDPKNPVEGTPVAIDNGVTSIFVSGRYAYVADLGTGLQPQMAVVDLSNPMSPVVVATTTVGDFPKGIVVQGRYAYVANEGDSSMNVVDVADPTHPVVVATTTVADQPDSIAVQGRYVYTGNDNLSVNVIDVADPTNPVVVATTTIGDFPASIAISGRYLYTVNYFEDSMNTIDVSNPANPVIVATTTAGAGPQSVFVSGRYAYVANRNNNSMNVIDIKGIETNGLIAHSAEVGSLQVLTNGTVANQFTIGGGLTVGTGGIQSDGIISAATDMVVGGVSVCLKDGTNCPTSSGGGFWTYDTGTDTLSAVTSTKVLNVSANIQNILDADNQPVVMSTTTVGAGPNAVFVSGKYAYTANMSDNSMDIVDVSDPANPVEVSNTPVADQPMSIFVSGRYAYIGDYNDQYMHVFDVSDPKNPVEGTPVAIDNSVTSIFVSGRYAYVADFGTGLLPQMAVVDLSNPMSPVVVATTTVGDSPKGIVVQGRYAYVANEGGASVNVVDVADPTHPVVVATTTVTDQPNSIAVQGKYVYTGNDNKSVNVIDISDPTIPVVVATNTIGDFPISVAISGRYLYTVNYFDKSMNTIDISDPAIPVVVATTTVGAGPQSVFISGRYAYTANFDDNSINIIDIKGIETNGLIAHSAEVGSLQVLTDGTIANQLAIGGGLTVGTGGIQSDGTISAATDVVVKGVSVCLKDGTNCPAAGAMGQLTVVGTTAVGPNPYSVFVSGKYAYTANHESNSMNVIDVTDPSDPVVISTTTVGTNPLSVYVAGRYAYIVNGPDNSMNVVDVSDPALPFIVATTTVGAFPNSVFVSGRYAYTANAVDNSMSVVDVSNPVSPVVVATLPVGDGPNGIYVSGRYAYVTNASLNSVNVIDVANPATPVVVSTTTISSNPESIFVSGRYAYTVNDDNRMNVIDISNPSSPVIVATPLIGGSSSRSIFVSGRYAYLAGGFGNSIYVVDVSNPTSPVLVNTAVIGGLPWSIFVSGKYAYTADINFGNGLLHVIDLGGIETHALTAHSAELGSLQVLTNGTVANQFAIGGGLTVGAGGIQSAGTISAATDMVVGGVSVCLKNGTNCPASSGGGGSFWSYDLTDDFVHPSTNTTSLILGGSSIQSAPVWFQIQSTSTNIYLGANGSSTNVLIGGATSTISNTQFQLDGNDLFVAGNIGSASSVYTNGAFIAGPGSTYYGDGFITKTNGSLTVSSSQNILLVPTGNVGIGLLAPQQALDVKGNIQDILHAGTSLKQLSSIPVGISPSYIYVNGRFAYLANSNGTDDFQIIDVTNPSAPSVLSTSTLGSQPFVVDVRGDYAYVGEQNTVDNFHVVDVSDSAHPTTVSTSTISWINDLMVSGRYVYLATGEVSNNFKIVDVMDPRNPTTVSALTLKAGQTMQHIFVQGDYAYATDNGTGASFHIVSIADPAHPFVASSTAYAGTSIVDGFVSGRYAYMVRQTTSDNFKIIDVSDPANPKLTASMTVGTSALNSVRINGRYAYITDQGASGNVHVIDVSDPATPTEVATADGGSNPNSVFVAGRYAYVAGYGSNTFRIFDVGGIETNGLIAASAEFGSLRIRESADVFNQLSVGGGIEVGDGGILSSGSLAISSVNTTSTFAYAVSSTYGEFSKRLTVGGISVCLANGTNCASDSADYWSYNLANDFVRPNSNTTDLVLGGSTIQTAPVWFQIQATSTNLFLGKYGSSTNIFIGGATSTISNSQFQLDGNDLFAAGDLGAAGSIYTNGTLYAQTAVSSTTVYSQQFLSSSSTVYGAASPAFSFQNDSDTGMYNKSANTLVFSVAGSDMLTLNSGGNYFYGTLLTGATNAYDLGSADRSWKNVYASGTAYIGTDVLVGNGASAQSVCLKNGTNCPASTDTLLTVTNRGNYATSSVTFYGGLTTSNLTATGTTSLQNTTFTNATGTNVTSTSLYVSSLSNLVSLFSTNATATNLAFTTATGTTLFANSATIGSATIKGGTINGTSIGGTSASTGIFTNSTSTNATSTSLYVSGLANLASLSFGNGTSTGAFSFSTASGTTLYANSATLGTATITGGAINGTAIGGIAPSIGIFTNVTSTNATTTSIYVSGITQLSSNTTINGQSVCLANGTNCPTGSASYWTYDATNDFVRPNTATTDLVLGGSTIQTAPVWFQVQSTSTNLYLGANGSSTNVFIGGATSTISNTQFQLDGNDLFVAGNIGSASSVYTNGAFIAGPGSTYYGDGYITKTNGDLVLSANQIRPATNNSLDLGSTTSSFRSIYASGTAVIGTDVVVGGVSVCLKSGTNCPGSSSFWTYNATNDALSPATSTTAVSSTRFIAGGGSVGSPSYTFNGDPDTGIYSVGPDTINFTANGAKVGTVNSAGIDVVGSLSASLNVSAGNAFYFPNSNLLMFANGAIGDTGNAYAFADAGGTTYRQIKASSLRITATSSSALLSSLNADGSAYFLGDVYSSGTARVSGLDVAGNITNLLSANNQPVVRASLTVNDNLNSIYVSGRYAYTVNYNGKTMNVIDVSSSTSPVVIATTTIVDAPYAITVSGRYAFTANYNGNSMNVIDVSNPSSPVVVSTTTVGTNPTSIFVAGKYAYVTNSGGSSINVVDVSNPSTPVVVATTIVGSGARKIIVTGRYAFVMGTGQINAVDVSNPTSPVVVATTTFGAIGSPTDMSISGRYAYVVSTGGSPGVLAIVDISNPTSMTVMSSPVYSRSNTVFVSGRYAYMGCNDSLAMCVIDITNPSNSVRVATTTLSGSTPSSIFVSGRYAYIAGSPSILKIVDIKGEEVNGLIAHSAELGSLQVLTNGTIANQLNVGGGLSVDGGGINSSGPINSNGDITVNGTSVCLKNGTNCPSGSANYWTYDATNDFVRPNSNTTDLVLGGSTVQTAPVWFQVQATSTNLFLGKNGSSTNMFIGGATSTISNTQFQLDGNDLFVAGNIGSASSVYTNGAFIAGPGSTYYGDGYITKTNGDLVLSANVIRPATYGTLDLGNATSAFNDLYLVDVVNIGGTTYSSGGITPNDDYTIFGLNHTITVNAGTIILGTGSTGLYFQGGSFTDINPATENTGSLNLGTAAASWNNVYASGTGVFSGGAIVGSKLTVNGNIEDILGTNNQPTVVATTPIGNHPYGVFVSGRYVYTANTDGNSMNVIDISKPSSPVVVATTTVGAGPYSVYVSGRYAYTANNGSNSMNVIDISKPASPIVVATTTVGSNPYSVYVSGKYAYVANSGSNSMNVIDVSSSTAPVIVATTVLSSGPNSIYVAGRYAYTVSNSNATMNVIDVSNPSSPVVVATTTVGSRPYGVYVQGRYAYTANLTNNSINVIDVSNPTSPVVVATTTVSAGPTSIYVAGRYAYTAGSNTNSMNVIDVSNPSSPVVVATTTVGSAPNGIFVSGRYAYVVNYTNSSISVVDIKGEEVNGLIAHSAEVGSLQVLTNGTVANQFTIGGGLNVGVGGIFSVGSMGSATSVYTNGAFVVGNGSTYYGDGFVTSTATNLRINSNGAITLNPQSASGIIYANGDILPLTTNTWDLGGPSNSFNTIFASSSVQVGGSVNAMPYQGSTNLKNVSTVSSTDPFALDVAGRYMYVANSSTAAVTVIDISDPSYPKQVGSAPLTTLHPLDVVVSGKFVYALSHYQDSGFISYLSAIDVSNPSSPKLVSSLNLGGLVCNAAYATGRYVYVTCANFIEAVDVTDPANLVAYSSSLTGVSTSNGLAVQGGYAYITDPTNKKLVAISVSSTQQAYVVSSVSVGAGAGAVSVEGRYAYVANAAASSFSVVDISSSTNLTVASTTSLYSTAFGANIHDLKILGKYLYVAYDELTAHALQIYDVSSSTAPAFVANTCTEGTGSSASAIAISGKYAFLGDHVTNSIYACELNGIETNALTAHDAELGNLNVRTNGTVANDFSIGGSLSVGSRARFDQAVSIYGDTSSTLGALRVTSNCGSSAIGVIASFWSGSDQKASFRCNGQLFVDSGTLGTPGDYAEFFPTADETLEPGDVVAMTDQTTTSVKRAMAGDREYTLGVISEHPLVAGNAGPDGAYQDNPHYAAVGLLGQLPVKASDANGPIHAGDRIMAGDDGFAVKASGLGMIIGQAEEDLTSTTGTIRAYVNPRWSAEDFFKDAGNGITDVLAQGTASTSTPAYDSFGISFQGTSWDDASGTVVTSQFTLMNDVISATSSLFTVKGPFNDSLLTISDLGDMGVTGDLLVGKRLFLGSKSTGFASTSTYLFVDDTEAPTSTYIATNADGWSTETTYDYAERFQSAEELVAGDIVVADPTGVNAVKRATVGQEAVLGIVSTKPGFITGAHATGTYPIALAGRVPTRVSTSNGPIVAGDQLAPSSEPGVAVKAVAAGPVVGIALEPYDAPTEGSISVFVQPGWKVGDIAPQGDSVSAPVESPSPRSGLARISAGSKEVNVSFPTLNAYPLITVAPYGQATQGWWLANVNDHGFTIELGEAPSFDLLFSWKAESSPTGATMSFSDGTSASYDPTSGLPSTEPSSAPTTTPPADPPADATSTGS